MTEAVLTINAGSSSIKFALYGCPTDDAELTPIADGQVEGIGDVPRLAIRKLADQTAVKRELQAGLDHEDLLQLLLHWIDDELGDRSLIAAGHRVVHGGLDFGTPTLIDESVLTRLERLIPLAPLHQPHNLAAIRFVAKQAPGLAQVACFDTSFHRTNSPLATAFALPRALTREGVRRYGFHGLSYEYISGVLPSFAGADAERRVIVAHLGHGASMCAMLKRRSVATTMGFTALDGLPMGRRCGALDPGVILFLIKEKGLDYADLTDLLYHKSGLLGVSGISDDMRDLLASQSKAAEEAVNLFVYRIGRELGSLAAALGGLDVLVFTGGIGEHATAVRERVCRDAEWLGVILDPAANERGRDRISAPASPVSVFVFPTNEDLMIARHTLTVLGGRGVIERLRSPATTAVKNQQGERK
jgi:acetate kinase